MKALCCSASWMAPGTNVFWGEPLIKGVFSRMQATAKTVEGETSSWPASMDLSRFSAVSLTPSRRSEKRSVLAVHWTMTLSRPLLALKSLCSC